MVACECTNRKRFALVLGRVFPATPFVERDQRDRKDHRRQRDVPDAQPKCTGWAGCARSPRSARAGFHNRSPRESTKKTQGGGKSKSNASHCAGTHTNNSEARSGAAHHSRSISRRDVPGSTHLPKL